MLPIVRPIRLPIRTLGVLNYVGTHYVSSQRRSKPCLDKAHPEFNASNKPCGLFARTQRGRPHLLTPGDPGGPVSAGVFLDSEVSQRVLLRLYTLRN